MRRQTLRPWLLVFALLWAGTNTLAEEAGLEPSAGKEPSADNEPTLDERLDALLAEVSAGEYGESSRCLSRYKYRSVKVLNTEYLLFSKGSAYWLNRLKRPCRSLEYNKVPIFESRGMNTNCNGDAFYPSNSMDIQRGLDHSGRVRGAYGICYLGSFEQIPAEQAALLMAR